MIQAPVFIKGNLHFQLDGKLLAFEHKNISTVGVTGLNSALISSEKHFGRKVHAEVKIGGPRPYEFETDAYVTREQTRTDQRENIKDCKNQIQSSACGSQRIQRTYNIFTPGKFLNNSK